MQESEFENLRVEIEERAQRISQLRRHILDLAADQQPIDAALAELNDLVTAQAKAKARLPRLDGSRPN